MDSKLNVSKVRTAEKVLPPTNENVIAITEKYSCLGCVGADGKWYSVYSNAPLPKVIDWEPLRRLPR
jgi:hypothetical protein